jgi:hypothetical protein
MVKNQVRKISKYMLTSQFIEIPILMLIKYLLGLLTGVSFITFHLQESYFSSVSQSAIETLRDRFVIIM